MQAYVNAALRDFMRLYNQCCDAVLALRLFNTKKLSPKLKANPSAQRTQAKRMQPDDKSIANTCVSSLNKQNNQRSGKYFLLLENCKACFLNYNTDSNRSASKLSAPAGKTAFWTFQNVFYIIPCLTTNCVKTVFSCPTTKCIKLPSLYCVLHHAKCVLDNTWGPTASKCIKLHLTAAILHNTMTVFDNTDQVLVNTKPS